MAKYDFNNTPAPYAEGFADGQQDQKEKDEKAFLYITNKTAERVRKEVIEEACQWWIDYVSYPQDTDEDRARNKAMIDEFRKAMTL